MKNILYSLCLLWVVMGGMSCSEIIEDTEQVRGGLTVYTVPGTGEIAGREGSFLADAYLFSNSQLKIKKENLNLTFGEPALLTGLNYGNGDHMYFFSSADKLASEVNNESDWLHQTGPENKDGQVPLFYTGKIEINSNKENLLFRRGVARIDVQLKGNDMTVQSVTLTGVASKGYLFEQETVSSPSGTESVTCTKDLSGVLPVSGKYYDEVFRLYEQKMNAEIGVSVVLQHNSETKTVTGKLPSCLERNKIYTIVLSAKDIETIGVEVKEWEVGGDIEMSPNLKDKILADKEHTVLSEGASLNDEGTVLTLPYSGGEQTLAFTSESDLEYELEGDGKEKIQVEPVAFSDGDFHLNNRFKIVSSYQNQEQPARTIRMKIKQKGAESYVNSIDIVLPENICQFYKDKDFTNRMTFKENTCDYSRYVDGTLGYLKVPENYQVSVTGGNWIRLDKMEGDQHIYAIEGGYKPNDPEADGRTQEAQIVVTYQNGKGETKQEQFSLKRQNWGLPVVEINGLYWCQYNLRGNSKQFNDQIPYCLEGEKMVENIAEFLMKCGKKGELYYPNFDISIPAIVPADEETSNMFYTMLGSGYQGQSGVGMTYKPSPGTNAISGLPNTDYSFWGYKSQLWPEDDTNLLAADAITPDGYQIPTVEHFRKLANSTNVTFGKATQSGDLGDIDNPDFFKRLNRVEATVEGKTLVYELIVIPAMGFINIGGIKDSYYCYLISEKGNETNPLVLMGHPSQIKAAIASQTCYESNVTAFVTRNDNNQVWRLNGQNKSSILLQQANYSDMQNVVKMIRCIKTPVKYIIK